MTTKTIAFALAAGMALGGVATAALQTQAYAQDATRPGMMGGQEERMHGPDGMRGHEGAMHQQGGAHAGPMMRRMREFGLIYPVPDRMLSGADVQKIAEAFLLFNGNHTWKVAEVQEEANRVLFTLTTPDGAAIAHFAMDRHSGRPERLS